MTTEFRREGFVLFYEYGKILYHYLSQLLNVH